MLDDDLRFFSTGEDVLVRHVIRRHTFSVLPARVVQDDDERIAYYVAAGTPWLVPESRSGRRATPADEDWNLRRTEWRQDSLWLTALGAAHAIVCLWRGSGEDREFDGWYVNLQDPLRRRPYGFDSMDHELDVVIGPDRSWRWKDVESLERLVREGVWTRAFADEIRREGEEVIAGCIADAPPFCEPWSTWRPSGALLSSTGAKADQRQGP